MDVGKLPEAFEDVAVYFTWKEWELLEAGDKGLYQDQMLRNYQVLVSLGYQGPTPDLICRIQQGEMELWVWEEEEDHCLRTCLQMLRHLAELSSSSLLRKGLPT
ncbi:hypothetical protein Y1Q_0017446 [Alligator mississippiensis]|uniref:Uncharacterized protein n=1 Tax=Alligator mississippiensis TaxID=8496 RepID=A0A151MKN8_ALLMI|nr:hypothetical protein Y1Q_0017446 [Alligator mississippiensis]